MIRERRREVEKKMDFVCLLFFLAKRSTFVFLTNVFIFFHSFDPLFFLPFFYSGKYTVRPIFSKIVSLYAEKNDLMFAVPGGLIGVGTVIDPTLTRADRLVGQVLGLKGKLPEVFIEVEISFYLLRRLLGVKAADGSKGAKVQKLSKSEILLVNIGSTSTSGTVLAIKKDMAKLRFGKPVCTQQGEKIALSRRVDKHWRLIGWGQINRGKWDKKRVEV